MSPKKPSSSKKKPYGSEEELINFTLWLKRTKKLKDKTIKHKLKLLKIILKPEKDLLDTEAIEEHISTFKSGGYRNILGHAYQDYLRFRGYKYKWKEEHYEPPLPFVPLEKDIDLLIAGFPPKYACFLQFLKEIGCSPLEAHRVTPRDFYLEKQLVAINHPVKNHKTKQYKMSDRLTAMITPFVNTAKFSEPIWQVGYSWLRYYFFKKRKEIAKKLNKPELLRINLKTFRHFKGTTLYHQTKDILHVKEYLRHRCIESTLVYTHLVQFDDIDQFVCRTANSIEEASKLIEQGFEYVTEMDNVRLFRKRK